MRAGVGAVQHTLTPAAGAVVRAAVAEAKSRGHNQVQPLHVAAILLIQSSPGSPLRRACLQSHSKDLSHPLQCRALELCFKIALDRLPSNQEKSPNPVLSNALVAALKRAQAHQRRGTPEQSLQPLLAVKVEMDQLIISILDDPSVSRVMREAGFSSTDVKSNMEEAAAQSSPSLTCSSSSLDSCSQLRRRERLAMTSFSGSPLEGVQFRHALFNTSPSFILESPGTGLRMVDRGMVSTHNSDAYQSEKEPSLPSPFHRQDVEGHAFSPVPPPFLENSSLFLKQSRLHLTSSMGITSRAGGYEEDVRNVVETMSKKRNPVLVSDVGLHNNSVVVREFSQRLKNGDVPAFLRGVKFLTIPFRSLTVGLFSQEEMEQKLAQLRTIVEESMPGGAIVSVGDLQWLVESGQGKATFLHSHARLVIQELTQFLDTYSSQRFWLLATASSQTFNGCQVANPSLETRLNLQPIMVNANSGVGMHSRYGTFQSKLNGQLGAASPPSSRSPVTKFPGMESQQERPELCSDCSKKYENELADLIQEDRASCTPLMAGGHGRGDLNGVPPSTSPQLPWLQKSSWPPLAVVKEEKVLFPQKLQDLTKKWHQTCSAHSTSSGGFSSTLIDTVRNYQSTSQVPDDMLSHDRNSPLMSKVFGMSKWQEPVKFLVAKSAEHPSPGLTKAGNVPLWATNLSAASNHPSRSTNTVSSNSDGLSFPPSSWMKKNDISGARDINKGITIPVQAGAALRDTMGADLALGRSSADLPPLSRDLREDGQQPLPLGGWKFSPTGNSRKERVPEVSLAWRVPAEAETCPPKATEQKPSSCGGFRPNDMDSLKILWRGLQDSVPWQREAATAVTSTVTDCRSGSGRKRLSNLKSDTWLLFLGPDRVGKREIAKSLAKLVFGDEKKLIWMQLSGNQGDTASFGSGTGILTSDSNGVRYRGKTPLDRLVEAVRLKPFSVVLLEDVDQADSVVRGNLLRAMERGKLASSNGKEVSFANVIVIMTCSVGGSLLSPKQIFEGQGTLSIEEEKLSRLFSYGMKFQVAESRSERVLHDSGRGVLVVNHCLSLENGNADAQPDHSSPPSSSCSKRRAHWALLSDSGGWALTDKRPKKEGSVSSKALALDLNLSAEENETVDELSCTTDVNTPERPEQESEETLAKRVMACARESLPKEIFELVDAAVMFKPFDFETLTDSVLEQLESASRRIRSTGATMEIDVAVLELLVSAAWQTTSDQKVFNGWVNDILVNSVSLLLDKREVGPSSVVKLLIDRGQALETQESASVRVGLLPASIKLG